MRDPVRDHGERLRSDDQERANTGEVHSVCLVVLSVLLLAGSVLASLRKYSWTGDAELARIIDPDVLLFATSSSILAMMAAVASRLLSHRGRFLFVVVAMLAAAQTCRLAYVYLFTPELIWHQ